MPHRGSLALLRGKKGLVLFWAALLMFTLVLQSVSAALPKSALAAGGCDSFAIFTSDSTGTTNNENFYESKPEVYLNGGPTSAGGGFEPGSRGCLGSRLERDTGARAFTPTTSSRSRSAR